MSSTGRKKVDDAILDYLSDLLTPSPDEASLPSGAPQSGPPVNRAPSNEKPGPEPAARVTGRTSPPPSARKVPVAAPRVQVAEKPRLMPRLNVPPGSAAPGGSVLPGAARGPASGAGPQIPKARRAAVDAGQPEQDGSRPTLGEATKNRDTSMTTDAPVTSTDAEPAEVLGPACERDTEDAAHTGTGEPGYPAWAGERFDVLLFEVAGLKLAVPLVTLGNIHRLDRELTHLFGMPEWFMGILPKGGKNIKVVDTALWVMPEKYDPAMRDSVRFVVTLHGTDWGLACHVIHRAVTLDRDDVKWRVRRVKRPWLAGTVVRHMCALLDVEALGQLLCRAEADRRADAKGPK